MYTGTLISDLIAAVERAEELSRSRRKRAEEFREYLLSLRSGFAGADVQRPNSSRRRLV